MKRFRNEAWAAGHLRNEHVVRVFDVGQDAPRWYIVMEYVEGSRDLGALVGQTTGGALPVSRAVNLVLQVADALQAAHEQGIIHRDIKPENLLVCQVAGQSDFVKVLDFGIFEQVQDLTPGTPGTLCGTPRTMAPEQAWQGPVTPAADVYGLGVVLYYLLTGRYPVGENAPEGMSEDEGIVWQFNMWRLKELKAPGWPPDPQTINPRVPRGLSEVVGQALCPAIEERLPSMEELAQRLEPFAAGLRHDRSAVVVPEQTETAMRRCLALVVTPGSVGTGLLVGENGLLLTAAHVLARRPREDELGREDYRWRYLRPGRVAVLLADGSRLQVERFARSEGWDQALLQVDAREPPHAELSYPTGGDLPVGARLAAYGFGEAATLARGGFSVLPGMGVGRISGLTERGGVRFLQSDIKIFPGMSGGPIFDDGGQVVAMVSLNTRGGQSLAPTLDRRLAELAGETSPGSHSRSLEGEPWSFDVGAAVSGFLCREVERSGPFAPLVEGATVLVAGRLEEARALLCS